MYCPLCHSHKIHELFHLENIPGMVNRLAATREEATRVQRAELQLVMCHDCTHLFNQAFQADKVCYDAAYGNALHVSPTFRSYVWQMARTLVRDQKWTHRTIVDIGCGEGYFLRLICALGANRGIGVDPASPASDWKQAGAMGGAIKLVNVSFDQLSESIACDKVICQHLLEHLEQPDDFLDSIIRNFRSSETQELLVEVPNGLFTLRDNGYWDLIHEHVGYFTPRSLVNLLKRKGYEIQWCRENYGRQFISTLARKTKSVPTARPIKNGAKGQLSQLASRFRQRYRTQIERWNIALHEWSKQGKRIFLWGAGSKGISFANQLDDPSTIQAIVDQNTAKQGHYIPGTGHRIISPNELTQHDNPVIIVMNNLYLREIESLRHQRGIDARCVSVMAGPQEVPRALIPALM